jgi:hypothetical protein
MFFLHNDKFRLEWVIGRLEEMQVILESQMGRISIPEDLRIKGKPERQVGDRYGLSYAYNLINYVLRLLSAHEAITLPEGAWQREKFMAISQPVPKQAVLREVDSAQPPKCLDVKQCLAEQKIAVISHQTANGKYWAMVKIAEQMGRYNGSLEAIRGPLVYALKNGQKSLTRNTRDFTDDQYDATVEFLKTLEDCALVEKVFYRNNEQRTIFIRLLPRSENKELASFFEGGWYEYYAAQQILVPLQKAGIMVKWRANLKIRHSDGSSNEIDLIFVINNEMYIVEVKSGRYQAHVSRFKTLAKKMNIPKDRAWLMLRGKEDVDFKQVSDIHGVLVMDDSTVGDAVQRLISYLKRKEVVPVKKRA